MRHKYTKGYRYDYREIDKLIAATTAAGYEYYQIHEGVLGCGEFYLIAPDENHYSFHVTEVAANCWSSYHTCDRRTRVPKTWWKRIDNSFPERNMPEPEIVYDFVED